MSEDNQQNMKKPSFLKKLLQVARSPTLSRSKHAHAPELILKVIPVPSTLTRSMSASCVVGSLSSPTNPHINQRSLTSPSAALLSIDDFLEHDNSVYTIRMSLTPALIREHEVRNILSH
ncbi:hypothetical protein K7432_005620 [Basidiobolus ranarum]|uniref:Uncharacterized protein n=1 Tax=Basidiobolus ranarum TaxID=34480 RepID=A0ABR2WWF2_9FUNG